MNEGWGRKEEAAVGSGSGRSTMALNMSFLSEDLF